MPAAALVKGILLSLGVLAALGFAAYENPEVQQWIDEQRRRLAELLRGIGEELDPQSRREAEAFAFHGRTPTAPQDNADSQTRGESTGASVPNNTVRRIPVQGSLSAADTEERQRLGREYLAARNQLLRVMRQRRGEGSTDETTVVNEQEAPIKEESTPIDRDIKVEQSEESTPIDRDIKVEQSEYNEAPPLPPKVKLEAVDPTPMIETDLPTRSTMPGSFEESSTPEMTYEEQIAHAIALSEQENNIHQATTQSASEAYDADVRKAVEASLRDFSNHMSHSQPVDLMSTDLPGSSLGANVWSTEEDLYNVTPNLTRASLAAWEKKADQSAVTNNPFIEHETDSFTSWSNAEDSIAQDMERSITQPASAQAVNEDDSDAEETGIVTPDSWTEVGSIPDESERVPAV